MVKLRGRSRRAGEVVRVFHEISASTREQGGVPAFFRLEAAVPVRIARVAAAVVLTGTGLPALFASVPP
jgi:hypothetical protein